MAQTGFYGLPPEARPRPACLTCCDERPCTWACLGVDSILAGSMWVADEVLAEFERASAEAPGVEYAAQGMAASFE